MQQKQIDNKNYILDDDLKLLGEKVIKDETSYMAFSNSDSIKIAYMFVYPNVSEVVAGRCIKSNKELKFFSDYDYLIQMSGDLWDILEEEEKYILMFHELLHISVTYDKKGNKIRKIRDHNLKDFKVIVEKYGINWINKITTEIQSIYDLDETPDIKI